MTTSPLTEKQLLIPEELKPADGRFGCGPSKVRPEALARLAGRRRRGDGHLAPPEAGQGARRADPRRAARSCSRCPTATRSRSATAARRPSGTPPPSGSIRERSLHLTYGEFSQKFATVTQGRAVPGRPDRRSPPTPAPRPTRPASGRRSRGGRRPDRLGAQRDLDRRDGPGAAPGRRGRGAGRDRRDLGRRRAAGRRSATPTSTTSRRRRASPPTAACGWRCSAPPRRSGSPSCTPRERWIPEFLSLHDGARELGQGPDLQHARRGDAVPDGRPGRVDARRGGLDGCVARTRASSEHLYGWAEQQRLRDAVRRGPGEPLAGRRHDRLRRGRRRRGGGARRCARTGSSTPSPTASSAATSCGSACSRPSRPPTCRR